jgi:acyl carrier protein
MRSVSADSVVAVVAEVTGRNPAHLLPALDLYEDLKLDSLGALELLVALEDAFGVDIGTDEAQSLRTVGDVVGLLQRRVAAKEAAGTAAGAAAVSSSRSRR